jgi:hypothetical protein
VRRTVLTVAAVTVGMLGMAAPANATGGVQHLSFSFDETAVSHAEGLGVGCPAFVGTMSEQRHDELDGIMLANGTVHGRTYATSRITLSPDDPTATSYTGGYVLRQTGTYAHAGEDDWVETATVHGTLTGSDGASYRLTEVVHLTTSHDGTVRTTFDRMRCS